MQQVLWWLAQNTVVVAVFVPLVLLLCRAWRFRPANQHLLWLLLLVKLLTPPLVCWPISLDMLAAQPRPVLPPPSSAIEIAPPLQPPRYEFIAAPAAVEELLPAAPPPTDFAPLATNASPLPPAIDPFQWLPNTLFAVWLAGAAVVSAWLIRQLWRQARILRSARPPAPALLAWVHESARLLKLRGVRVRVSDYVGSPLVACLGRPTLIWPAALAQPAELAAARPALVHELAHLARRDHVVLWLELLAMPLWWFNPLLWLVLRRLEETRELACDALALEAAQLDRRSFAELLLALAAPVRKPLSPAVPLAAGIGSAFHRRLAMLFCDRASGRTSLAGFAAAGLLAAAALPGWAQTGDDPKPKAASSPPATTAAPATTPAAQPDPQPLPKIEPATDPKALQGAPQTFGAVEEIKDGLLVIQISEAVRLLNPSPLCLIRVTDSHTEMIGQVQIVSMEGTRIVGKLDPQLAEPKIGDRVFGVWPKARTAAGLQHDPYARPGGFANAAASPYYPATVPAPPVSWATPATRSSHAYLVTVDEAGLVFQLDDGSRIVARLSENGRLALFLEKDGERKELKQPDDPDRRPARPATSTRPPTPSPELRSPGTTPSTAGPLTARPKVPQNTPSSSTGAIPVPSPAPARAEPARAEPARNLALLESDLELAKLEVEEKQILFDQTQALQKKGFVGSPEVKLKEIELRKAQVRLRQTQIQLEAAKPPATTPSTY